MSYRCSVCQANHDDLPDIGSDRPDHFWGVPEAERAERIEMTPDTCIIDNEFFFVRGVIEIPVHDQLDNFGFGVWASLKKENFYIYLDNYNTNKIGPFFGWLCTELSFYDQETISLKTMVHFRGADLRPSIILEPTGHPLSLDQQKGISLDRAWEIVHYYYSV